MRIETEARLVDVGISRKTLSLSLLSFMTGASFVAVEGSTGPAVSSLAFVAAIGGYLLLSATRPNGASLSDRFHRVAGDASGLYVDGKLVLSQRKVTAAYAVKDDAGSCKVSLEGPTLGADYVVALRAPSEASALLAALRLDPKVARARFKASFRSSIPRRPYSGTSRRSFYWWRCSRLGRSA